MRERDGGLTEVGESLKDRTFGTRGVIVDLVLDISPTRLSRGTHRIGDEIVQSLLLALVLAQPSEPLEQALPRRASKVEVVRQKGAESSRPAGKMSRKRLISH